MFIDNNIAEGGSGSIDLQFFTSVLIRGEWLASRPIPGERDQGTPFGRVLYGPQSRTGSCGERERESKREISYPCRKSNPGRPARSPSLYRLSYPSSLHGDRTSKNMQRLFMQYIFFLLFFVERKVTTWQLLETFMWLSVLWRQLMSR
jgi:hypothetical protein